jgi:prepilin-type N-terminal cleavage/methylation domain-containing protein
MHDERPAPPRLPGSNPSQAGMSLIEVLIAVALMVTVALSLLPLFSRSIRQNREGGNFTELTNVARSSLEEYLQLDFNSPQLTIPAGSDERLVNEYWDGTLRRWMPLADPLNPPAGALWQRSVQVQQFAGGDLLTDGVLDDPVDGGALIGNVQLKMIRVTARPLWRNFNLGRPTPVVLEVIKAL